MKTLALFLLALAQADDPKARELLRRESEGAWKKIEWQKDFEAAKAKAREGGKPILAILIVGHMAQKGAAEC